MLSKIEIEEIEANVRFTYTGNRWKDLEGYVGGTEAHEYADLVWHREASVRYETSLRSKF
jgi:hypothetical protein